MQRATGRLCRKFVLANHFRGEPKYEDIKLVEQNLPSIKDGEFLCRARFLSVDPYMRPYSASWTLGTTMKGSQVAEVIESKNHDYKVGDNIVAYLGWRTHTIVNPADATKELMSDLIRLPDFKGLPASLGLGAVGMPGNSAYFGYLEICQPKAGDVVVVSGAAGAVGSLVGQIAKIKNCYVIGFAGSDDKVDWLVNDLGFDCAYNYKKVDVKKSLKEAAPNGVDCFFDNVGGLQSSAIRSHMNRFGRISVCGAISSYNSTKPEMAPCVEPSFVFKQLKMEGFLVQRWYDRYQEGMRQMLDWILEGKIKVRETYTYGFDNMPRAFIEMLQGANTGKAIIKCEEEPLQFQAKL